MANTCQSCGMPLKQDADRGTEADGAPCGKFCVHCYANGRFKQPDVTAAQMQEFDRGKMVGMGFPRFLAGLFTRGIPKLERWRTAP